jgi:lysophospholipase L1-like esterase
MFFIMTEDREIAAENRETMRDEHAQAKSSLGGRESFSPLGRRIANSYKVVAIVTLNTLILFACFELAATLVAKNWKEPQPIGDEDKPRAHVSYYASQAWAKQYWEEFSLSRQQLYHPYVLWRRAPLKGDFVNINRDGIRLTPGAVCSANSYKVFAFGGSTMWGTGAPDWGTIPAYLQAGLTALLHQPVCVTNFGESAFVSTQGVIQLILALKSGNVPNLVIFYDGVNNIYAAYQSGRPTHQNFDHIATKLQKGEDPSPSLVGWIKSSNSFQLLERLMTKPSQKQQNSANLLTYKTMGISTATLTDSVVECYISDYEIVDALAQKYGFKFFFFWQPIIMVGDKPLTGEEQEMKRRREPALIELYESVYARVQHMAKKYENLYYIANIFDEYLPLVWIDEAHVTPVGNQMIAQKVLQVIIGHNQLEH